MSDILIADSAVEKRRIARKNIVIGLFLSFISFIMISIGNWITLLGILVLLFAIYKGFFRGIIALWIYKE